MQYDFWRHDLPRSGLSFRYDHIRLDSIVSIVSTMGCRSDMTITIGVPDLGRCGTHMNIRSDALFLSLTSHQQLRSYGDGTTAYSLIRQTGEVGDRACDPWFTRQVTYPLHHSGSVLMRSSQTETLCCDRIRLWSRCLSGSRSWIIKINEP